jgi:outer membrane protein assembly factor BamB
MKRRLLIFLSLCLLLTPTLADAEQKSNWPHWRGPNGNGLVDQGDPPVEWDETRNIRWKVKIPGTGYATPLVWGERIFVQTAIQTEKAVEGADAGGRSAPPYFFQYSVLALDRRNGEVLWERMVREAHPHEGMHPTASFASTSGATDGERLYAYFGSQGLYCFDLDGNLKWEKDLGKARIARSFGEGSSPTIYGNALLINWDHEGDSFIVALDKLTGEELWHNERDERTSWSTPLVVEHKGKHQVIVSASKRTRGYDLASGKLIWECAGLGANVVPMPLHANGVVYVTSGHRDPAMQAILLDKAKGDITGSDAVLWSIHQDTPYVSSPILYGGRLYFMKNRYSTLSCYDAETGEALYGPQRLEGMKDVYASLVGVKDRVYISGLGGTTLVIKNGPEYEVLASNKLDEPIGASPVMVDDELYLRGNEHLYCIAKDE